jgi:hypothetical protein
MKNLILLAPLFLSGCFINVDEQTLDKGKQIFASASSGYPHLTKTVFVNQCAQDGADRETCECLFRGIEKNMPYKDFQKAEKQTQMTGVMPNDLLAVILIQAEVCVNGS